MNARASAVKQRFDTLKKYDRFLQENKDDAAMRAAPDVESILRATMHEIRRALGVSHGVVRLGMGEELPIAGTEVDAQ